MRTANETMIMMIKFDDDDVNDRDVDDGDFNGGIDDDDDGDGDDDDDDVDDKHPVEPLCGESGGGRSVETEPGEMWWRRRNRKL